MTLHTCRVIHIMFMKVEYWMILMLRCACVGSSNKVKSDADSDDISEHPPDDKPSPYSCTVCHKRFIRRHNLNVHRKRHTGENVYSCTLCEKRFSYQSSLYRHMNIHTGKYKCTECGRYCQGNQHLANHRRSHS